MLTEEEKQAISKLKEIIEFDKENRIETIYDKEQIEFRNNIELVLNLVEKLQKQNEEPKNTNSSTDNSAEILEKILGNITFRLTEMKFELDKQKDKILDFYHEQINRREWWKDEKFLTELLEEEK